MVELLKDLSPELKAKFDAVKTAAADRQTFYQTELTRAKAINEANTASTDDDDNKDVSAHQNLFDIKYSEDKYSKAMVAAMQDATKDFADLYGAAIGEKVDTVKPEAGTKPRVYYRNLWRYSKSFIGGSVATEANGVVDCVEGATVRLIKDGQTVARATTDNYGDFKFDKLDENSGAYVVEVTAGGRKKAVEAKLGVSVNLGEIRL
jgi:hypothetical protein